VSEFLLTLFSIINKREMNSNDAHSIEQIYSIL